MAVIIPRTQGPQVQQQGIPSVRNTANVDMSGVVRSGLAVQGAALDYLKKQQDINDTTAVMQARRELSDWEAQTFDPANPEGIGKYKGKDALGANEALLPSLDSRVSEIRGRLNARQQAQFDGVAASFRDSLQGRLNGYMDREHSAYLSAEQRAAIDNIGQDAVAAGVAGDFGRQDQVVNELLAMNRARRAADGMGEELIKAEERGMVSSIRSQTIEGMLTARPFEAQAYFERYADQMSPEDRAKVERALYPVVSDAEASDAADAIMAGATPQPYRDPGARGRGPAAAVAKILDEEADAAGVPREYLYALAEQESGFNPKAVNPEVLDDGDNATGLFQYRRTSAGGIDRTDARASARRAAQEFAARTKRGGAEFAVAAHFAGEGGADAVVNRGRTAENPKTARYVQQVMGRAARWRSGDAPAAASAAPRSEADAIELANATYRDPRQRAAVVGKIRERFNLADMRRQEQNRAMSESIYTSIYQAQNPSRPLRELIGANAYAWAVARGDVESLETLRRNRIEGTFTQDDAGLVEALSREAVLSPNTFAKRDIYALAPRLSTDTLGRLLGDQKALNDPKKAAAKQAEWATESTLLGIANQDLGITGKDNDEQRLQFQMAFLNEKRAFIESHNGRAPSADEMQTIINRLKLPMFKSGWLWRGSEKPAFEADIKQGYDVPPAAREKIIAAFAQSGATPTENEVREYYFRNVGKTL